ncbi:hypothetical protein C8R46DRAFT_356856 [Mycena filopes]|nr:hypothetical protein C8R46DRAFT_356856 [Mycena filopes]
MELSSRSWIPANLHFPYEFPYDDEEMPDLVCKYPCLAPLIASNDVPQPAQLAILWEIRREHQTAIFKVDTDIADVESALEALEVRRVALLREQRVLRLAVNQFLGLMSLVRRLPPEILGEIFLYLTPVVCKNYQTPWYLGQICHYWRRVALSLRPLWSVFDFSFGRRSETLASMRVDSDSVVQAAEAAQKPCEPQQPSDCRPDDYDDEDSSEPEEFEDDHEASEPWRCDEDFHTFLNQLGGDTWSDDPVYAASAKARYERVNSLDNKPDLLAAIKADKKRREKDLALAALDLSMQRTGQGPFACRLISTDSSDQTTGLLTGVLEGVLRYSDCLSHLVFLDAPTELLHTFSQSSGNCPQLRRLELVFTTVNPLPTLVWPASLTELVLAKVDLSDDSRADDIPWAHLLKYDETDCIWDRRSFWDRLGYTAARSAAYQRLPAGKRG